MDRVDYIFDIYKDKRTVFKLPDIAMLFPKAENKYLANKMGYYVKTGKLLNLRKGVYAKPDYNPLEFANLLYSPSYVSLEYVLQQAGVVFQYDSRYTSVSYLSREVEVDGNTFSYRRIKEEIIINTIGIIRKDNTNIATPERAFLDVLYLNKDYYFDNLNPLNRLLISQILPVYESAALEKRVTKLARSLAQTIHLILRYNYITF
jgi:hypothetical protein